MESPSFFNIISSKIIYPCFSISERVSCFRTLSIAWWGSTSLLASKWSYSNKVSLSFIFYHGLKHVCGHNDHIFELTIDVQKFECAEDNFRNWRLCFIVASSSADNVSPVDQAATADVVNDGRIDPILHSNQCNESAAACSTSAANIFGTIWRR